MRNAARILAAVSFAAVGLLHFTQAATFVAIMPPYVPAALHLPAVYLSGVAEVAGGWASSFRNCDGRQAGACFSSSRLSSLPTFTWQ